MQSTAATADVRNPSECDRCRATFKALKSGVGFARDDKVGML